ncbi:hypothetical protein [Alicyclobacillus shizuokensis]|uniref:hypothetical protein n=1 Tax=Alicyclobacillus shizuokensis TaxID=392014 RepID=UPI00082C08EB|nr:hypothetical protein [Alicyclobacillus shizuokensis]
MATPNYMTRISFLDGQILHDFHLNIMQSNIAEAIKLKTTTERYDMLLLISPYNYYFAEPFVDTTNRDASSTAELDTLSFSINQDSWITPMMQLPEDASEIYLLCNKQENPDYGATVSFFYRTSSTGSWIPIEPDTQTPLGTTTRFIQLKATCNYTGTVRPILYDFCLMWK